MSFSRRGRSTYQKDKKGYPMSTTISQARPSAAEIARPDADAGYAICAEALIRQFGEVRAVDEVDLRIPAGEIYGFLGPNGAGKHSLLTLGATMKAQGQHGAAGRGTDDQHRDQDRDPDRTRV